MPVAPNINQSPVHISCQRIIDPTFLGVACAAEPAADVARFLVPRVREVPTTSVNPLTGALSPTYIRFLTQQKALQQVAAVSAARAGVGIEVGMVMLVDFRGGGGGWRWR